MKINYNRITITAKSLTMIVELFTEPLHRRYFAPRFSIAYLFTILCKILLTFLPLLLSYRNGKIWLKHDKYLEQPNVQYTYKMILVLHTTTTTTNTTTSKKIVVPNELFYSTIPSLNMLRSDNLRIPIIRSRELDINFDGIMDSFWLNALTPLLPNEYVHEIQVSQSDLFLTSFININTFFLTKAILIFNYKIQKEADLEFDSLAYIHHTSGMPTNSLHSVGQFTLLQSKPFSYREMLALLEDDNKLLSLDDATVINSIKESNIHVLLERWSKMRHVMKYDQLYATTQRAYNHDECTGQQFYNLTLHANIPNYQEIWYKPGIIEVLYHAWIRYIALLIIVGYLIKKICSFVFYYQM